mgnify:CR=1 FL=1
MKIKNILVVILATLMMSVASVNAKDSEPVKVVYAFDFPDVKRVHFMLNTLNNLVKHYQETFTDYELSIVLYGPSLQYIMKDFKGTGFARMPYLDHGGPEGNGVQGRLKAIKQSAGDNMEIFVCQNTMENKNVKPEQLVDYAQTTPGGILKLIELQHDGAAYIKIK